MLIKSILIATIILVHSWYPWECCSEVDCHPIPCDQLVQVDNDDWQDTSTKTKYFKDNVKISQDQYCHVCNPGKAEYGRCAFIVPST